MKTYDIFTFFNEFDLLEIRLELLYDHVDYFVIIESDETFSGNKKEMFFKNNKHMFEKYKSKIIYFENVNIIKNFDDISKRLNDSSVSEFEKNVLNLCLISDNIPPGEVHWLKEFYQKEFLRKPLLDLNLNDDDLCFVSDLDEMWNPNIKEKIDFNNINRLRQLQYVYFLNNRSSENWAGTIATKYGNIKNNCLNHIRTHSKNQYTFIENGGWHFTFMGGMDRVIKKIESYGHQEYNTSSIKNSIEEKIKQNRDFIDRPFNFWIDETDLPPFLLKNKNKYIHLFK